ncbi:hypothetical protein GC207_06875 [bacterium]|nr:hypothetical protein [bacterium]
MNNADESKLEQVLHRELRELPDLRAPATLAPRVLAALAARHRAPWWKKSWVDWPPGLRVAFLSLSLLVTGGLVYLGLQVPHVVGATALAGEVSATFTGWYASVEPYVSFVTRLTGALELVLKAAPASLWWGLAAVVGLAYATCIGLGTLGYRVAFNRM